MAMSDNSAKMPSHIDERLSLFDRFATYTSERVSRAWFFGVACLACACPGTRGSPAGWGLNEE